MSFETPENMNISESQLVFEGLARENPNLSVCGA